MHCINALFFVHTNLWLGQLKHLPDLDDRILLQPVDFEQFLPVNVIGQSDGDDGVAASDRDRAGVRFAGCAGAGCWLRWGRRR